MMRNLLRTMMAAMLLAAVPAVAEPLEATHDFKIAVPRGNALRFEVDIPASDLEVRNSEGTEIEVSGTVTRRYDRPADAGRAMEIARDASVKIDREATRAVLRRKFGPNATGRSAQGSDTRYRIQVRIPKDMHLEIHQKAGDVDVAGLFGDVIIGMRAGDVSVVVPKKTVKELMASTSIGDVTTNLGDRIVSKEGLFAGSTHFFNEGGHALVKVDLRVGDVDIRLTQ